MAPDIGELSHEIRSQLTLHAEVPLINLRHGCVVGLIVGTSTIEACWIGGTRCVEQRRPRILRRAVVKRIGLDAVAIATQKRRWVYPVGGIGIVSRSTK